MSHALISTIVEGYGEVSAVPVLLRRIAAELAPETWLELPRPYRVSRDGLLAPYALERAVAAVAEQGGKTCGVLVLLDADDACPAELGPELLARVRAARPRDCKGWLSAHRVDGRGYKPASDQAALAAAFDLQMAREHSASFDKLWRDLDRLLRATA